jgi:hypothetical protein
VAHATRIDNPPSTMRLAGLASLAQGLLLFIPLVVLGQAIEWPASLGDPAAVALPRLLEQESAVRLGYVAYLVYSILFALVMMQLARVSLGESRPGLMRIVVGFAIASTVARSIGIVRWLVPMPQLAQQWQSAGSDQDRYAISVAFESLNAFGGTIGEVLGVSLFAAISLFVLCSAALRVGSLPQWLGLFGILAAVGLVATTSDLFGVDPGALAPFLATTVIQLWFLAMAAWLLTRGATPTAANPKQALTRAIGAQNA